LQIHLVALISPELDYDIIPHWIRYYNEFNIDTRTVFLNTTTNISGKHTPKYLEVKDLFELNSYIVLPSFGGFNSGDLKIDIFNAFKFWMHKDDYLLVADSDEFQQWGTFDIKSLTLDGQVDFFHGYLVDCYGGKLTDATPGDLNLQYPMRTRKLEYSIVGCPVDSYFHDTKILMSKVWVPVCFHGSHEVLMNQIPSYRKGNFRGRGEFEVLHFRYRKTLRDRLMTKRWNTDTKADKILEFFNEEDPYGEV